MKINNHKHNIKAIPPILLQTLLKVLMGNGELNVEILWSKQVGYYLDPGEKYISC